MIKENSTKIEHEKCVCNKDLFCNGDYLFFLSSLPLTNIYAVWQITVEEGDEIITKMQM